MKSKYNQVANYIYLDTQVNISIGKKAPNEYFVRALNQIDDSTGRIGTIPSKPELIKNLKVNCIPSEIASMTFEDYERFLLLRRNLMAKKIEEYYKSL